MDRRSPGAPSLTALLHVTVMGSASGQEGSDPEMPEAAWARADIWIRASRV